VVAAGQGTVALEMLEDVPDLEMLAIPVGGGGLATGMGTAARALKPGIGLIGVEAQLYPSLYNRLKGTDLPCGGDTLAEGIAVKEPGNYTAPALAELLDDIVLLSEGALERAVSMLLQIEKTVVEGAGAAGLAALLAHPEVFRGRKVGLVLSGGNIDTRLLASVLLRGLVRDGRIVRLRVMINDLPGQLARVSGLIGKAGGNIVEVQHQRLFGVVAKRAELDVTVETRDRAHVRELVAALQSDGFVVRVLEGADI
jgi:threonine dehydratase